MDNENFLKNFISLLTEKESNFNFIQSCLKDKEQSLMNLKENHKQILSQISLDVKSSSVIQQIFDKVSDSGFRFLEDLINQGLSTVYPSQPMQCSILSGVRGREKTVEFRLNDGKSENPLTECGGGVQTVVSLVLRVYYIVKNNLRRTVFLDESFTAISGVQLEPFMGFLESLVKNLGFDFIWITHNESLIDHCENVYSMSYGNLEKTK